jgi:thioredoxin 1
MWHWTPFCLLALALIACSSPEPDPAKERAPIRPPGTAPASGSEAAPPPEPTAAEGDRPDAGANRPQLAALALGRPMLLDFTREDCLPCKLMEPWLAELRSRHAGVIEILEVDLDLPENRDVARFFKARSVPMQVYVDARGVEVSRNVGLATLPQMQQKLEKLGFPRKDGSQGSHGNHGNGR